MSGRISRLLDPSRILLGMQSTRRDAAIDEVARLLENHPDVTDFAGFHEELLARERLDTTCLGNAIALPHARTGHVKTIVLAIGRSSAGVHFETTGETVRLLFVLGTPATNPGDYLQVVSALCKIFSTPSNRDALLNAATPAQFIAIIVAAEEKLAAKVGASPGCRGVA